MRRFITLTLIPLAALAALGACSSSNSPSPRGNESGARVEAGSSGLPVAADPILLAGTAYETAESAECIDATPENWSDLHNVIRLSDNIISGSEPIGAAAYERIAAMGVKTVLSVDGKSPDVATAAKFGLRYVHVPIKYSGMSEAAIAKIAKTFRELPAPFFVHCFHGKHRGPAGAMIGRLVLDGATREVSLAQMRQCGTSKKYEGLYRAIATAPMPSAESTTALAFDFPSTHPFEGERQSMIEMARHWDNLVLLGKRSWKPDPAQPDLDALNEAQKLQGLVTGLNKSPELASEPDDYRGWMHGALASTNELVSALQAHRKGDAAAAPRAAAALAATKQLCSTCHGSYRN